MYPAFLKFPGIVVLHDYVMLGFYCEKYFADGNFKRFSDLLVHTYPRKGARIARDLASRTPSPIWNSPDGINFPMNEEIVSRSHALVVHSDFVRQHILRKHQNPVTVIPHHGHEEKKFNDSQTRRELGIGRKDLLLVSAGFINQNKRFRFSIPAVTELEEYPITFLIIGSDESSIIKRILRKPHPRVITRGFLPLEDMERYISAADICINLRYPTMGESSGSLLRMMGYGKPVLVSDCGSYRELPDYTVLKVPTDIYEKDILQAYLKELARNRGLRESIGLEARQYVKTCCDISRCAEHYVRFIREHPAR
jgi:glycosyltransferase involved in cell wall biosynthesis